MAPIIELKQAGRCIAGRWLWRHLNFSLDAGIRIAVVGPTGSGKSTLLRALALLDGLNEGMLLFHGNVPGKRDVVEYRRRVHYVFQKPAFREGTVGQALDRAIGFAGIDTASAASHLRAGLEKLHLSDAFLQQDATRLSGGEAQLAALLRALVLDPEVLLLDEPTAAMDAATAARAEAAINVFFDDHKQRALVWVGHDAAQRQRMTHDSVEIVLETV